MSRKKKSKTLRPPQKSPEIMPEKNNASFFDRYGSWITLLTVSAILFIVFRDFIFENSYYLFKDIGSDSLNQSYPLYVSLTNYIKTDGFPMWSFQEGMGQNIMALTTNRDPFSWIIYIGSVENIMYRVIWLEIFKILLTAVAFYHFLKLWGFSVHTRLIGTVLYSFSGFMIVGSGWTVFSAEACLLALLLLGFEQVYQDRSWYLFPLAVMLIAFRPFNLYFYSFFLLLYFIMRHLTAENHSWRRFLRVTVRLLGYGLLGILISSFFFVSGIQLMMESPRVGGSSSYLNELISTPIFFLEDAAYYSTAVLRLFSNDILGNGSQFRGWYNYLEAPLFYIGLFSLLMAPQLFFFAEKRKRMIFGMFLLFFVIPVIFPFFRYALWLFMGDYFRGYSIFLSLAILIPALIATDHMARGAKLNLPLLSGTLIFLIVLLFLPFPDISSIMQKGLRITIVVFLVIYFLIILVANQGKDKFVAAVMLVIMVILESGYMNTATLKKRVVLTRVETLQKTGYNDYTVEAMDFIHKKDNGFYRVNKDYFSGPTENGSMNDAKVQGFYGTMNYSSFNQRYYIRFLEEMGIIKEGNEYGSRWANGLINNPLLLNLASNKYQLSKRSDLRESFERYGYDSIASVGDVTILENTNFVPLGFTYDRYIPYGSFRDASRKKKVQLLSKTCIVEEPLDQKIAMLSPFDPGDTARLYMYREYRRDCELLRMDTLTVTSFSQNAVKGHITVNKAKMLFFSIPFDEGWRAKIDGEEVRPLLCNIGFMGLVITPGSHQVELSFLPPYFTLSLILSVVGLAAYFLLLAWEYYGKRAAKKDVVS